jgi:hypothetical protein
MKNATINDVGAMVLMSAVRRFPRAPLPEVLYHLHRADADGLFDGLPTYRDMQADAWVDLLVRFYDDYLAAYR